MIPVEYLLLSGSVLLLLSIIASKTSGKLGIPSLLLFLLIGMLAGAERFGHIHFYNPWLAQLLGVVALSFILFSGGLDTNWENVKPIFWKGVSLSTIGVLITTLSVGWFSMVILKLSLVEGFLLGAIVSSTDAAAVFPVLKSRNANLKSNLRHLLEFEAGSNDPMAVFLTIGFIDLLIRPAASPIHLVWLFVLQMGLGLIFGYFLGKLMVFTINHFKLESEGLYPVLTVSLVLFIYGLTVSLKGSGFLAVYAAGLVMGNKNFTHKKSLTRFHDGLAWLMQIVMFLTLGILVSPSGLVQVIFPGLVIALFLLFISRPASIMIALVTAKTGFREKIMISWVGLRGAVPIVLATFPLLAGVPKAELFFNLVFFIVLTSSLIQGTSIPFVSKILKVDEPFDPKKSYPIEFEQREGMDANLVDFFVPFNASVSGKMIMEIGLPQDCLITLVCRDEEFIVPSGMTVLEEGDVLLILANKENARQVQQILSKQKETQPQK